MRGFLQRQRFKRLRALYRITGKINKDFTQEDILKVPQSKVAIVRQIESSHGVLKLTEAHKLEIIKDRANLEFVNGHAISAIQTYTGFIDPETKRKEGFGLQVWNDGSIYEGFWKNNKAHGEGRFILANGDMYVGNWANDKADGHG